MRTRSLIFSATTIAALVLALAAIAVAADPFVGTWKMNPAKSKFSLPPLKSYTFKIEGLENGYSGIQDMVNSDGKVIHATITAKFDGKDYPIKDYPDADMMSFTRPNPNTTLYVAKKAGKEAYRGQSVVSKDGKTLTDVGGGKDEKGQAFTYTIVMEKQ
jgi:hypothetical protein